MLLLHCHTYMLTKTLPDLTMSMQTLAEAQQTLKTVIQQRVQDAIHKQEHDTVVRFVKLYAPLRIKVNETVFAVCNWAWHFHAPCAVWRQMLHAHQHNTPKGTVLSAGQRCRGLHYVCAQSYCRACS